MMGQNVKRNFVQCSYLVHRKDNGREFDEEMGCHNTYHFDDIAILRIISTATSRAPMITTLSQRSMPLPFCLIAHPAALKIATKAEVIFLLAHLIGDLHQPLHVGAVI